MAELDRDLMNKKIDMPEKAAVILRTLESAGYEAYVVGGCVRDALLGRTPQDWDITTSALPEQVKAQFRRTIDTGIQHGTVTVMMDKEGFEVTTYRIDGEYGDGRHPDSVEFCTNLREDLRRRDFTINAMAYNPKTGVVDLFGGQEDLAAGIIRCVGEPRERFGEDALRMMRALRFAAQLDFAVEEDTRRAICEMSANLSKVSMERIAMELVKLLVSMHPEYVRGLYETGIYHCFYEDYGKIADTEQEREILTLLPLVPAEKALRLAVLLRFDEQPEKTLRRLKFDNDTVNRVGKIVKFRREELLPRELMGDRPACEEAVRREINRMSEERFLDVLVMKRAELSMLSGDEKELREAEKLRNAEKLRSAEKLREAELRETEDIFRTVKERGDAVKLADLAVTGRDLIACGIAPGPKLGETLAILLDRVLARPEENEKEHLLSVVRAL